MRTDAPPLARDVAHGVSPTGPDGSPGATANGGHDPPEDVASDRVPGPRRTWRLGIAAGAFLLLGALGVLVHSAVSTSSARVTASTSGEGVLVAGDVVLDKADSTAAVFLDADELYPGLEVSGCAVVEYSGSVPATIRLHGDPGTGTGLDAFIDLRLARLPGNECPSADAIDRPAGDQVYVGRLDALWTDHASWADGLTVDESMAPGDRLVIEAVAVVVDDDAAQGLTTDFALTVEGRPS